jgi:HEAT repeat protein
MPVKALLLCGVFVTAVDLAGAPGATQALPPSSDLDDPPAMNVAALFDRDPVVREDAVRALGMRGKTALPDLLRAILDPERRVRSAAVESLADVGGDDALAILAVAVTDREVRVREDVVHAAARIGGTRARELLQIALVDPDEAVRESADEVLRDLDAAGRRVRTRGERPQ